MQGQDIFGPAYQPRTHVFAARDRMDTSIDRMRAVRTDRYKYIRNYFPMIPYMQHNEYKEQNYPTWNLVKEWVRQGKLNREQALFASDEKPVRSCLTSRRTPMKCTTWRSTAPTSPSSTVCADWWTASSPRTTRRCASKIRSISIGGITEGCRRIRRSRGLVGNHTAIPDDRPRAWRTKDACQNAVSRH